MIKHGFRRLKWVSAGLIALIKHVSLTLLAVLILFLGVRVYQTERGPDLQLWHTWHGEEMSAKTLESATFAQYQAHEARLFDALKVEISDKLGAEQRTPINRYWAGSRVYPQQFTPNENRSFVLLPQGRRAARWSCCMV